MAGANQAITIQLGEDYVLTLTFDGVGDLTDYTFEGTVRDAPLPDGQVIASFTWDYSAAADAIAVGTVAAEDLPADLAFSGGTYQVRWTPPDGVPFTIVGGPASFTPQVVAS